MHSKYEKQPIVNLNVDYSGRTIQYFSVTVAVNPIMKKMIKYMINNRKCVS